ncbi:helix-turn-helix transcriptional regulator [Streptococcus suis]|uniref:helix-turn-helix transcriptional regulator n=1 Tax=Streptococcus suis TaxID=1307 RepID=UPI000942492F|nr:helix-turn-helix transcriptional regulator [Streptococcus suis]MBS8081762.1 helix-turn-helix transcriptional regulator [Streptococcus suis]MCB2862002.1 helix-turn-helix transcriptional regulator [Streptococcus suis]MCB2883645.1 helix-turn-helix transcriptional regulator [Streptococcus suis]MCB2888695.1 helix-turn-helix transcriptional regulator [Streptococcus suis]MCB2910408.1 helix-turn-helix transcriptional regulator [Streptococcus suis]
MIELTLRDFRLQLGLTVEEMAEELYISKGTYWYWESKNKTPEDAMQKVRKIYDKTKEFMVDDGIDIIEKIGTIKRHYRLSHDSLAQLVGAKYGTSVVNWMNGVQPRLKYMIRINELYYGIVNKKRRPEAGSRATFCRINPLDRESWKVKTENQVIVWK